MVIRDGRNFDIRWEGDRAPPLIAGGLDGQALQAALNSGTVISYSHAGSGESDPGPLPRSTAANVADLREALDAAGYSPPYFLVGYSAWAFDMLYFALNWPEETVGLVLVDPSITYMDEKLYPIAPDLAAREEQELRRLERKAEGALKRAQAASHSSTTVRELARAECALSEWKCFCGLSSDEVERSWRSLGDMPLVVLSANEVALPKDPKNPAVLRVWKAEHERYAALSSRGELRPVESGHDISMPKIASAIEDVIAMAVL